MKIKDDDIVWELRHISTKLKALGSLIETQNFESGTRSDHTEIQNGISMIIDELGEKTMAISRKIEKEDILGTTKNKGRIHYQESE